jgi:hypothetical protein
MSLNIVIIKILRLAQLGYKLCCNHNYNTKITYLIFINLGYLVNLYFSSQNKSIHVIEGVKKYLLTELNKTFSKEEIQMAKKHMTKCSPSLAVKEMQIKTTLRFHLNTVRIAIIKNTINKCW